ncbi:hypothetical protein [Nostoc sp.]|uniref:hypothetical protein n=1 Tax=Nostoc sp. TaxID=1180 RepID=UPI002FFA9A74
MRSPNSYFNQVEKLLEELSNKNSEQALVKCDSSARRKHRLEAISAVEVSNGNGSVKHLASDFVKENKMQNLTKRLN